MGDQTLFNANSCHWVKPSYRKMLYEYGFNYFLNLYEAGESKQNSQNN